MPELIDAHHHLWHYAPREFGWIGDDMEILRRDFTLDDLSQELRTAGIDGSIVVQARQTIEETRWLLRCADKLPEICGVVGWLPLASPSLSRMLGEFRGMTSLKGLRHVIQDEPDDNFILRPEFNRGIASLLDAGLVYDILIHQGQLPQATAFAKQHPHQVFVLDHLAKPKVRAHEMEPWRDNLMRLAECENVSCKLSGLVTEADWENWTLDDLRPYLDVALKAFGSERLLAGSDWPVCLVASSYKRWWATLYDWSQPLAAAERKQIFGENAKRVYRLT